VLEPDQDTSIQLIQDQGKLVFG